VLDPCLCIRFALQMSVGCVRRAGVEQRLVLLGGFAVLRGQEHILLPLGMQRVLGFLALRPRPVLRTHVACMLWTNTSGHKAAANLRTTLWRLRHLSPAPIESSSSHIGLAEGVTVDVREQLSLARRLIDEPGRNLNRAREALAVPGELLPDWYDDWVLLERERFHQIRLHALESLCRALTRAGRFGQAVEAGLAAVEGEPVRESAHQALIEAYLTEGNLADAIHQFEAFSRQLKLQLGLEPSFRLREAMASLRVC
jgi:DNA-binding SARP family transcriptional activator